MRPKRALESPRSASLTPPKRPISCRNVASRAFWTCLRTSSGTVLPSSFCSHAATTFEYQAKRSVICGACFESKCIDLMFPMGAKVECAQRDYFVYVCNMICSSLRSSCHRKFAAVMFSEAAIMTPFPRSVVLKTGCYAVPQLSCMSCAH